MKYLIGSLFLLALNLALFSETITIVADEWPPFNIVPGSEYEGYMVDIARTVFSPKGIEIDYKVIPWKRAVKGTRDGDYNAVIGASRTDAEGFIFPNEELAQNILSFYVKNGNPWIFENKNSLDSIKLGTIGGYDYRKWLNAHIKENESSDKVQIIMGDSPLKRNLQKVILGRIDVVVDNEAAIRWVAKKDGILDEITAAGYGKEPSFCYIAFSPNIEGSKNYAQILSDGIKELRSSGELQIILDKYGLNVQK